MLHPGSNRRCDAGTLEGAQPAAVTLTMNDTWPKTVSTAESPRANSSLLRPSCLFKPAAAACKAWRLERQLGWRVPMPRRSAAPAACLPWAVAATECPALLTSRVPAPSLPVMRMSCVRPSPVPKTADQKNILRSGVRLSANCGRAGGRAGGWQESGRGLRVSGGHGMRREALAALALLGLGSSCYMPQVNLLVRVLGL